MKEDNSFVLNIRANPDDETARLIYADYLEERGDPRGELIRVQCELGWLAIDDPLLPEMTAREDELLAEYGEEWLAPLRALGAVGVTTRCFRRGLIERVVISAADFAARAEAICRAEPALNAVQLKNVSAGIEELAAARFPIQIRSLDLSGNGLQDSDTRLLKKGRWIEQIEDLNLAFNKLGDGTELFAVPWPRLRRLSLARAGVTIGVLSKAGMPALQCLSLKLNALGSGLRTTLFYWPHFRQIEELDLAATELVAEDVEALASPGILPLLRKLNLRSNRIGLAGMRAVAERRDWNLTLLDLRNNLPSAVELRRARASGDAKASENIVAMLRLRYGEALVI
jgi:uncharacterized protein (TIGR02996 family)